MPQNAYAIASATAAAIVAAGVFAGIGDFLWVVRALGGLALAAWLFTAGAFMWVSRKVPTPPSEKELKDAADDGTVTAETFASLALSSSGSEAESVEKKLFIALVAASVALVLTAGAFASALIWPPEETSTGVLTLTTEAAAAVDTICPGVKTSAQLAGR